MTAPGMIRYAAESYQPPKAGGPDGNPDRTFDSGPDGPASVSYTHLDVYKRQERVSFFCEKSLSFPKFCIRIDIQVVESGVKW